MACATIHLAIAKEYLKKHKELDYKKIISGTLYPDGVEDSDGAHFTDMSRGSDNLSHVRGKVDLYAFLKEHPSLDDFGLAWFLHLVTDYLFFEECFSEEYLLSRTYDEFRDELYFAYTHINLYLSEKYHILDSDYKDYPGEYYPGEPYETCILPIDMMDNFIKRVASIDLDKYIQKIKKYKKNIEP